MFRGVHLNEMAKTSTIVFMKTRKSMVFWRRETCHLKKNRSMMGIYIFKALVNRFHLTPKLMRGVREQSCL